MKPIYEACELRPEVLKGDLDDAIFGADFGHVIVGGAPGVYQTPEEFFKNTHPAVRLKKVVSTIFERLADPNEAGALVRLSTGYGGGKTHTLIALWHLANNAGNASLGTELLPAAGRPKKVAVAGVDGDKCGTNVCGRHDGIVARSLWGEIAYQLGGKEGLAKLEKEKADDPEVVPDSSLIRSILPSDKPVIILLDEVVLYMAKLTERGRKALLSFINALISEVRARRQAVLVITDPADQMAYQKETADLADEMGKMEAAQGLDDVLGRKMTDFDPIGDESAQVIIRRLFVNVNRSAAEEASAEFYNAYQRVAAEYSDMLPTGIATTDYAKRILDCYPFHPRLLETAKDRLGAMQVFQKSRGTLRLFARILRDVWDTHADIPLISAGEINWESDRIQADLLRRLGKDNFMPSVDADVIRHAGQLDADYETDIHRRVASALLLESLPLNANAAMDKKDITLATLRPSDVGNEPGEAIDRIVSVCWHTYKNDTGDKFQFRYDPNANKIIEEALENVLVEDAKAGVRTLVLDYFKGQTFQLAGFQDSPSAVPDSDRLKLVLADSEGTAQAICDYEDDSDPNAKRPRRFRNAILAVAPTPSALDDAIKAHRWVMAAENVSKDHRDNKELTKQIRDIMPTIRKRAQISAYRAFNRVVFQGRPSVSLDEKYLVSEDSVMERPSGQANLKQFLDDTKRIYQPNDALDVDLLLDAIVKGSTPSLDHHGAYPASAVHERALSSDKVRLMRDGTPIINSIIKAVGAGKLVARLPNGDVYDSKGSLTGAAGNRKRNEDKRLSTLKLESDVFVAPAKAECVPAWIKTDEEEEQPPDDGGGGGVFVPDRITAGNWDDAIGYAAKRPMYSLKLKATKPDTARTLTGIAQPFGAQSLKLSVSTVGNLKEGGEVRFMAEGVKYNSNVKPIDTASTLMRAMEDGSSFDAELAMDFGESGTKGAASKLEGAKDNASGEVEVAAEFGKEE